MSQPVPVDPARLFQFVGGPGLSVLFVSIHPWHAVNGMLCDYLSDERGGDVALGTVDLRDLIVSAGPALRLLHEGLRACGGPSAFGVLPGYWLFREGQVLAWDSGLPTRGDAKAIAGSALVGAIWSAATRRMDLLGQALRTAAEDVAARRIAARFREAAGRRGAEGDAEAGRPPPRRPSEDELSRAYELLGVARTATDEEVKRAWRRRQMENHPDRAARDPAEFERRSRLAAEINQARHVIFEQRSRATAGANG